MLELPKLPKLPKMPKKPKKPEKTKKPKRQKSQKRQEAKNPKCQNCRNCQNCQKCQKSQKSPKRQKNQKAKKPNKQKSQKAKNPKLPELPKLPKLPKNATNARAATNAKKATKSQKAKKAKKIEKPNSQKGIKPKMPNLTKVPKQVSQKCQVWQDCRDWKSDNSRNVKSFVNFWKNRWAFQKKACVSFKIAKISKFAVECVSKCCLSQKYLPPHVWHFFWQKKENFESWKKVKIWWRKSVFSKRSVFVFLKAFFTKWEGAKYAVRSQATCFMIVSSCFRWKMCCCFQHFPLFSLSSDQTWLFIFLSPCHKKELLLIHLVQIPKKATPCSYIQSVVENGKANFG